MTTQDTIATVLIDGVEYQAREHGYNAAVMQLSDDFKVTLPAPGGKVRGPDGTQIAVADACPVGAPAQFYLSDPNVQGGAKVLKLRGRITGRAIESDPASGTVLCLAGKDLGWHLSGCPKVHVNIRGLTWRQFAGKLLGMTLDPTGKVTDDAFGWGFKGVGTGNVNNRTIKLGRQTVESDFQRASQEQNSIKLPRFQTEPGQTFDSILCQYARINHYLVNVSTDGWLQIFKPAQRTGSSAPYTDEPRYVFHHHAAEDSRSRLNNVMRPRMEESGDGYFTRVECWSSVIDTINSAQSTDYNAGTYHGSFANIGTLPFDRLYTFADGEQMGTAAVNARAKWQWQRFLWDGWTYTFETVGHSQGGFPFVDDTLCELHDSVYGLDGVYYVAGIECSRKLARPGFDRSAGTRTRITLKKSGLLVA